MSVSLKDKTFGQRRNEQRLFTACFRCSWQKKLQLKLLERREELTRSQRASGQVPAEAVGSVGTTTASGSGSFSYSPVAICLPLLVVPAIKIIPFELLMTGPERRPSVILLLDKAEAESAPLCDGGCGGSSAARFSYLGRTSTENRVEMYTENRNIILTKYRKYLTAYRYNR